MAPAYTSRRPRYHGAVPHVVLGTAGHIDHGKSALVRALTGTDPDRLPEEKRRGITIELGFAVLEEGDLRLHFVDVPGHERLVHTMIAGAGGIDLALLVVAADEGVMPQTREHLDVIRFMGVPGGAVALNKIDLVDPELAALAAEELRETLRATPFAGAPLVPVSAVTGEGIPELRRVLLETARRARPRELHGRPFRLAVDRVFTRPGAGTVVTGTSLWGRLRVGDPLLLLPAGLRTRARRLQVHGTEREEVEAGERVAVALAGLRHEAVRRGDQLLAAGPWRPTRRITARLELLPSAPGPLDEGSEVELHALAARTAARIERLAMRPLPPGGATVAQLALAAPMVLFPGDRGVLRRPAPVNTFGGVLVLDAHPARVRRRDAAHLSRHPRPDRAGRPLLVARWLEEAGLAGLAPEEVAARLGTDHDATEAVLGRLTTSGDAVVLPARPPRLVAAAVLDRLERAAREELRRRLEGELASTGIPARDFIAALLPRRAMDLADRYLEELRQRGAVALVAGRVVPPGRSEHLTEAGQELARRVEAAYLEVGLDPPPPEALAEALGARRAVVEGICRYLVERGALVRLAGRFLIHRSALEEVEAAVRAWPRDTLTVGEFKERFGLTRKLAIPILEWLDGRRVTTRRGAARAILKRDRTGGHG